MGSNNKRFSLEELDGRPLRLLIGGSPCTHWSIAQKNNRETKPEGLGWELFENYLIAKEKFKPDFFLYENNKSAAQPIGDYDEWKHICKSEDLLQVKIYRIIVLKLAFHWQKRRLENEY